MKTCTSCKEAKPITEFFHDKRRPNGRMARCKLCKMAAHSRYRKERGYDELRYWKNPQAERERHLVRKYGVTQANYDAMLSAQGGRCAICHKTQERAFDVDHDHTTGVVRGLLCTNCNRMIGHAGDDADRLEAAAAYLRAIVPQVAAEVIEAYLDMETA